jgi:hypothetical protein
MREHIVIASGTFHVALSGGVPGGVACVSTFVIISPA